MDTPTCHRNNIYMYLLSAVCLTLLPYVILSILLQWYRQFCHYHTTLHFHRMHGHDKGPSTAIAIELSNLSEIVNIHTTQVKIPITLLSVHDANHHDYHVASGNWFYDFLKLSKPIFLIHGDCNRTIHTPSTFELGLFQHFKLRLFYAVNIWLKLLPSRMTQWYLYLIYRFAIIHSLLYQLTLA